MKDEGGSGENKPLDLKVRTRAFALAIVKLYALLPKSTEAQVLGKQVLRSGTSVGAHYREGQCAKSDTDLISKMEGALQELEETAYWLELLVGASIITTERAAPLSKETDELTAIFVSIVRRLKAKR